jgi:PHD/YefM family antitoxin component YafN of YafNO toxin-antitoxin module
MPTTNISVLRKDLFNSIDNVIEYNEIITVNTKKGNAIIISEEDYNALLETLALQSDSRVIKKIKDGEKENIDSMTTYNPNEEW